MNMYSEKFISMSLKLNIAITTLYKKAAEISGNIMALRESISLVATPLLIISAEHERGGS